MKLFYLDNFIASPQDSLWHLEEFLGISHMDYQLASAKRKFNTTKELVMPNQWQRLAMIKLRPQYQALAERGLLHPNWTY